MPIEFRRKRTAAACDISVTKHGNNHNGCQFIQSNFESRNDTSKEEQYINTNEASKFEMTNATILAMWQRITLIKAIGIVFAFISVAFWSSNGLFYKLNQTINHIPTLETLTISSFIVSLVYLCIIFWFYEKVPCTESMTKRYTHRNSNILQRFVENWSIILGEPGERHSLILRCVLGTISLACFYSSYRYIPLGDATTIRFTSPVFIAIFAHFLVQEPFGLLQAVNSCSTLVGVILIGRPSFLFSTSSTTSTSSSISSPSTFSLTPSAKSLSSTSSSPFLNNFSSSSSNETHFLPYLIIRKNVAEGQRSRNESENSLLTIDEAPSSSLFQLQANPFFDTNASQSTINLTSSQFKDVLMGLALALIAAIAISISMIFMKKLKKTPAPLIIFWFSISNVILGIIGLLILGEYRIPTELNCWIMIFLTTLCSGVDQLCITLALKLENAGAVAVIQALCVVLSFVFSIIILNEPLYWTSALGGTFIFLSVIALGFAKMLQDNNGVDEDCRKRFSGYRKCIFQINLIQNYSGSLLFNKSKSFDVLSQHVVNLTPSDTVHPQNTHFFKQTDFLPQNNVLLNEPNLLRISPICSENLTSFCCANSNIAPIAISKNKY